MIKTPKFTIADFKKIDNVFEFETEPIDVSDVVSISIDFMFSFAIAPTENVEVEIFGSQDGVNFGENNLSKFQILTYSLNTRFIRSFSFNAINYIKLKVKVPHVADIKLTGVKEKDISPNLEIQNNLLADRNPSPTDDITEGYVKGSIWINNLTGQGFICYDNTNENAVWHTMDSPEHEISGNLIRFRNPDGSWGDWINTSDVYWGEIQGTLSSQTDLQNALNGKSDTSHIHSNSTTTENGFMSSADKTKLNGIEDNANNYTLEIHDNAKHSTNYASETLVNNHIGSTDGHPIASTTNDGFISSIDKTKLNGIEDNANNYTLETHDNAKHSTNYASETLVNNHIGSTDGHPIASTTNDGFISSIDKTKLNGIEDNANNYTLEIHDNTKHTVDYAKQTDVINNFSLSVPEGAIAYFTNSLIDNINGIKPEGYDITAGINRIEAINYGNTGSYNKIQIDGIDALTGSEIVEEGSNANGNYIKYENGVIIEYTSLNLIGGDAPGGIDKYQNVWTFPSMFANNNYIVSGTILGYLGTDSKGLWSMLRCLCDNSSFANIVVHLSDNILVSGDTLTCYLLAIGRWK
jgi:hypothetical protein